MNLRYYLSFGMIASGVFTFLFGLAYYLEIHSIAYFIVIQVRRQKKCPSYLVVQK
jgi:OPA family glycerol-3-phosphate transporter-like MFS transporter 1/2